MCLRSALTIEGDDSAEIRRYIKRGKVAHNVHHSHQRAIESRVVDQLGDGGTLGDSQLVESAIVVGERVRDDACEVRRVGVSEEKVCRAVSNSSGNYQHSPTLMKMPKSERRTQAEPSQEILRRDLS